MITYHYLFVLISFLTVAEVFSYENHGRDKRFVVFPRGGIFKIVIGIVNGVKLGSKQSMGIGWNFQFQYALPTNVTQIESYPPIYAGKRSVHPKRADVVFKNDRAIFYHAIEETLNSEGINGRQCLLKSICENVMESVAVDENGLYGRIFQIILTPNFGYEQINQELDPIYLEAQNAGEYGVNCDSLYPECSLESGLLDLFSVVPSGFSALDK